MKTEFTVKLVQRISGSPYGPGAMVLLRLRIEPEGEWQEYGFYPKDAARLANALLDAAGHSDGKVGG
jgi:hypothetical protein